MAAGSPVTSTCTAPQKHSPRYVAIVVSLQLTSSNARQYAVYLDLFGDRINLIRPGRRLGGVHIRFDSRRPAITRL